MTGHVACMEKECIQRPELMGRLRYTWEDNIKINLN
jgi:hypothetical protein